MDVPEKLYFFEDEPVLSARSKKLEGADIEYTRTDAFIDKAAEWLEENMSEYCDGDDIEYTPSSTYNVTILQNERMIEEFKNYMKGEEV